jgi:hypothetical protein
MKTKRVSTQRYKLLKDDDGHAYIIPVEKEEEFEKWVRATTDNEDYEGPSFEHLVIGGSPSLVTFTDPQVGQ